jgi:hypothetical protein
MDFVCFKLSRDFTIQLEQNQGKSGLPLIPLYTDCVMISNKNLASISDKQNSGHIQDGGVQVNVEQNTSA